MTMPYEPKVDPLHEVVDVRGVHDQACSATPLVVDGQQRRPNLKCPSCGQSYRLRESADLLRIDDV